MKTKTITTEEKTTKNESNLGFKKGMLGKCVSKEQANIRKGTGKRKKDKRNPKTRIFPKRELMDKKQRKMEFWKGRQRKTKIKTELEEKKDFKDKPFGGIKLKKL